MCLAIEHFDQHAVACQRYGTVSAVGEDQDALRDEVMKQQIAATIKEYLKKEGRLKNRFYRRR